MQAMDMVVVTGKGGRRHTLSVLSRMIVLKDAQDAIPLLRQCIDVKSTTEYEVEYGNYIAGVLTELGYTVEQQTVVEATSDHPARNNVLAYRGNRSDIRVLFNSHLDTVPPHILMREDEDNLYGRGSCDAKASCVAQITAVELFLRDNPHIKKEHIGLLYVVGEEVDHAGMYKANDLGLAPEYVIVGEPTENKQAKGHKGIMRFTLKAEGKAAHSGYPHLGVSATERLVYALNALTKLEWPEDERLGKSTFNIGELEGGLAANIVAPSASAICSVRVSTTCDEIARLVRDTIASHEGISMEIFFADEKVVCHTVEGIASTVAAFFTDIPCLRGSHKSLLIGPGSILVAHGENEFVAKKDVVDAVHLYMKILAQLLK